MDDEKKTPLMLVYLFGEGAEIAHRTVSERMLRWCKAFEAWLEEIERDYHPTELGQAKHVWREFLGQCGKPPWETTAEDVQRYVGGLQAQGKSEKTIYDAIRRLEVFYRWCGEAGIDPGGGAGSRPGSGQDFNPAAGVRKPRFPRYNKVKVLSREEAQALLEAFKREGSSLSRRDYAFLLARLRLGRPFKDLQQLRWGQIGEDKAGAWVAWADGKRERLEEEIYTAILNYLREAGRLEGIDAKAYIFAPLKYGREQGKQADDWDEKRYLVGKTFGEILRRFGRAVGIPKEKLTVAALRHTAASLRVEAGDSLEEIQAFLGRSELRKTRAYVASLPTPVDERPVRAALAVLPNRKKHHFKAWENMTHGAYVKRQPAEDAAAMRAENVVGLKEEIQGLQVLGRKLVELASQVDTDEEEMLALEAAALNAGRVAALQKTAGELARQSKDEEDPLVWLQKVEDLTAGMEGKPPERSLSVSEVSPDESGTGVECINLADEIVTVRLVVRRAFCLAMESQDARVAACQALRCGRGCMQLAKLLRAERLAKGKVNERIQEMIQEAIREIIEEKNLSL